MATEKTNGPLARAECESNGRETKQRNGNNSSDQSQRINPVNLPAERSVLGALIEDDSLKADVLGAGLRSTDFALSDHRQVFDAMLSLWQEKRPVDYVTVAEQLGNRQEHYVLVGSLIQGIIVHSDHVTAHAHIVQQKARLRALLRLAEWITRVVDDTSDPDALIEEAIGKLEAISCTEVRA